MKFVVEFGVIYDCGEVVLFLSYRGFIFFVGKIVCLRLNFVINFINLLFLLVKEF